MDMQPCPIGSLPAGIKKNKLGGVAMANERLLALRKRMAEEGIDAYYVPTSDFHDSEYVEPYFGCRQFLSGFTGSAGVMAVTKDFSGLWTDGRYFVQAGKQLSYRRPPCLLLLRFFQLSPFFPEFCRFFHQRSALPFQNRIIIKQNSNPSFVPGQTRPTDEEKKLPDMVFPV